MLTQGTLLGLVLVAGWFGLGAILVIGATLAGRLRRRSRPHVDGDFALPEAFKPDDAFARARRVQALYTARRAATEQPRPVSLPGEDGLPIARGDCVLWHGVVWEVWAVELDALILTQNRDGGVRAPASECTLIRE